MKFKHIPNWPYMVSETGVVKRIVTRYGNPCEKIINQFNNDGYKVVTLYHKGKTRHVTVSRLMCEAFYGENPEKQAAHKDGIRHNNRIDNLYWATTKEQIQDREKHGNNLKGEKQPNSKLTEKDVKEIRRTYKNIKRKYPKKLPNGALKELKERFSISSEYLCAICSYKVWKHI